MQRLFTLAACAVVVFGAAAERVGTAAGTPTVPPILMDTKAGTQRAAQESYCLAYQTADGTLVIGCADTVDRLPRRLSVVRPDEHVQIRLRDARAILHSSDCGADGLCEAHVSVSRLGCDKTVARFDLQPTRTTWRARLEPGAYELSVFIGNFTTGSASGDTSGSLGLLVDRNRQREIISARGYAVCD